MRAIWQHKRRAEGYRRLWVAEHHNMADIASAATAVVVAHTAAGSKRIRLRGRLANAKEITIHRMFWKYGRDSFGEQPVGRSFYEAE